MNILIGKTIKLMQIAEDKMAMRFLTSDDKEIIMKVDADCCSHTWIEDVNNLSSYPFLVTDVQDLELNTEADTRDGELAFYGCKISTNKGDIVIDYRNESNGYYGGNIAWPKEGFDAYDYFYGGVYGQNISNEKWIEIK